nr:MAG TPA: protein of unknown function DUF4376 [Caudoviricetes sp.]
MKKINFIKTFIPQGDFSEKYEHGGMMVRHLAAALDEKMGAYECYECTVPISEYDEDEIQKAFVEFSDKMDALKLELTKADKIAEITAYDTSSSVNGFKLNGMLVWLDKATRVGLMNSTTIAKAAGQQTTTLWLGEVKLEVECDKAIQLLSALEMYALECFNVTAAHKKAVSELKTIKEVEAFDVTADYPQQLVMKL